MKKNLFWVLAATLLCGILTTSCEKKTEVIPLIPGQEEPEEPEKLRNLESLSVKYEASASEEVQANYQQVGTAYIRYVDATGAVKDELFTGSFTKAIDIPITESGVDAALEVIIVPKNDFDINSIGDSLNVSTNMTFSFAVNYDDDTCSETFVFSTAKKECAYLPYLRPSNYSRYVERFGGFVPAMVQLGFSIEKTEYGTSTTGPIYSAASFWRDNAYKK